MAKLKLNEEQRELFNALSTEFQKEIALAYIKTGYSNQSEAYRVACKKIGKKQAKNIVAAASESLNHPNVSAFLDSVRVVVADSVQIDAAWVLMSAKQVFDRCMQAEQVTDKDGNSMGEYKFEHSGANKALEIIGKHVKVRAFDREEEKKSDTQVIINIVDAVAPDES